MTRFTFQICSAHLAIPLLLSPYVLGIGSFEPDSSWTEFAFSAGTGSYAEVSRDCNGNVISVDNVPFRDAGASIDYYSSVYHLGLDAGVLSEAPALELFRIDQIRTNVNGTWSVKPIGPVFYTTPTVGLNTKYFGLDAGYALPFHKKTFNTPGGIPTGSLRIGRIDAFHFRFRLADDLPLITGGPGVGTLGFGFNLGRPRESMWLGLGAAPYDGLMFGSQLEIPLSEAYLLRLGASFGGSESIEFGFSAGTKIVF